MALVHDLCEIYSGDATPYDSFVGKSKKEIKEILKGWPRFSKKEKEKASAQKYRKEKRGLEKLITRLSPRLKSEIRSFWLDYEKGLTREGRFMRQVDRLESFLQALEYLQEDKGFPIGPWWIQAKELIDDPILIKFMDSLVKEFPSI
jgi:putative hydrolase of HD superfamily